MIIKTIKTNKVTLENKGLFNFLDENIPRLDEKSVVVITSKIVSIFEKRVVKIGDIDKDTLIKKESEYYLPKRYSKMGFVLCIKNHLIIPSAGIDESNAFGNYVLWPKDPFKSAKTIWKHLKTTNNIKYLGIVITDSKTTPLRWGTTGVSISHCGFSPLKNYIGKPDIFGRKMKVTKSNIVDGLAAAAVVQMGEGNEQTPIVIIKDLPFVRFKSSPATEKEIESFHISIQDDLYSPILSGVSWHKGGSRFRK